MAENKKSPKYVYILRDETKHADKSFRVWSIIAFQDSSDLFDYILRSINDKEDRRNVRWRIELPDHYNKLQIIGEGEFASMSEDNLGEFVEAKQTFTIEKIWLREAT